MPPTEKTAAEVSPGSPATSPAEIAPAPLFAPTRPEAVFGMLRYRGRPKTLEEMDAGVAAETRRRRARGRY